MSTNTIVAPTQPRSSSTRVFVVNLIFGGALAVILKYLLRNIRELTIVFDNAHELEKLREQFPGQPFLTFALGQGSTPWSLNPTHPTANSTSHGGFGGCVRNGALAARELLTSSDFQGFLQTLPDQALIQCGGGAVSLTEVHEYGSRAGAACTGASTIISPAMTPHLLKVGAPLEWHTNLLGPTTFLGIAERARTNGASALLSETRLLFDRAPNGWMAARSLMLHELPPYRDDGLQRNRHLLLDAVVMRSKEMQNYLRIVRPNWANTGNCGGVVSRQVDLMSGLDSERDIVSVVATYLQDELNSQFEEADPDHLLIDEIRWSDESSDQKRESISDIVSTAAASDSVDLLDRMKKPPAKYHFTLFATTAHGSEFHLERISETFAVTPQDLNEFLERIKVLRAFSWALKNEEYLLHQELSDLEPAISNLEVRISRLHDRLLCHRFIFRERFLANMERTAEELRFECDIRTRRLAELNTIQRTAALVDYELQHHEDVISDINRELTPLVPRGSLKQTKQYVVPCSLANAFPILLAMRNQERATQNSMICSLATQVTSAGLAKIVGASNDRLEAIARNMVFGDYSIACPPHGGRERCHTGATLYSIPPIDDGILVKLTNLVHDFDDKAKVIRNDTLEFGATVARTRFYRFQNVAELFDGLTGADLFDAKSGPHADLNSPDGFAGLREFGAFDGDGRVEFPSK